MAYTGRRTSVEMAENYDAAHIKTTLDASAINVRKGTISRERKKKHAASQPRTGVLVRPSEKSTPSVPGAALAGARKKRAAVERS
jgi:hypothetical protein